MIQIRRPKRQPAVLTKRGASERQKHCDEFSKGKRSFGFDPSIYAHATVKTALVKAQHDKCCFCESQVTHVAFGHVEHFRPKGGVRQGHQDALETPGYFWLAYEWTNLLFACELCNSRFKKNLFPLHDPGARARNPTDDIDQEAPLFLNPAGEDPENHIGFRDEYPYAVNASSRGDLTWRALGLDREQLAERRRDHLRLVRVLRAVRDSNTAESKEAAELLRKFESPKGPWSAMVRAALAAP